MIDHRHYPHIIDLILQNVPLRDHHVCRAVCRAWRDRLDTGLVKHVAIVLWLYASADGESKLAVRTKNRFNDKSRLLCDEPKPPSFWTFNGEEDAEAQWRAQLADVEIVDIEVVDIEALDPMLGGRVSVPFGFPADACCDPSIEYSKLRSTASAVKKLVGMVAYAPIVRWQAEVDTAQRPVLGMVGFADIPRLRGLGAQERVYFSPLTRSVRWLRTPSKNDEFSPIFWNVHLAERKYITSDDSSSDTPETSMASVAEDTDSDSDDSFSGTSEARYYMPPLEDVLGQDTAAPPPLSNGQPHVTVLTHGSLRKPGQRPTEDFILDFLHGSQGLKGWNVWVVGLERFLGPKCRDAWDDLLHETQGSWRKQSHSEDAAEIRFMTHQEYRDAVNDPWVYRVRTVR